MGEDLKTSEYDRLAAGEDDGRVVEWEIGLPSAEDLTPLWQPLITPELASAFSISPEPSRSIIEVQRASRDTVSSLLRRQESSHVSSSSTASLNTFFFTSQSMEEEEEEEEGATTEPDSYSRKVRWESDESIIAMEEEDSNDAAPSLKRPRLVCMPQLHKRFVDVVAHLGVKNAVPQTIMQLMNVEGLTRENVAGHLEKYRLYLERQQKQQGVQFK